MKIKFIMLALLMNHAHSRCAMNPANFDSRSYGFFIQQLAPITLCVSTLLITPLVAISMYGPCRKSKKPRIIVIPQKINVAPANEIAVDAKQEDNRLLDAMVKARQAEQQARNALRENKDSTVIARLAPETSPRAGKGRKKK